MGIKTPLVVNHLGSCFHVLKGHTKQWNLRDAVKWMLKGKYNIGSNRLKWKFSSIIQTFLIILIAKKQNKSRIQN